MLKGSAIIEVRDSRNRELRDRIQKNNVIFDATVLSLLNWEPVQIFAGARISISTQQTTPNVANPTLTNIIGTGSNPDTVKYYDTVTPSFGEIRNIISAVGFPRTFHTVGLTNLAGNPNQSNLSTTAYCYLLLDFPCTQGEFNFLDIYYRIEFLQKGTRITPQGIVDFGRHTFALGSFKISNLYTTFARIPTANYENLTTRNTLSLALLQSNVPVGWTSGATVNSHFKWKQTLSQPESWQVGTIIGGLLTGVANSNLNAYRWEQYPGKISPIQNGFFHKASSTRPLFNDTNFGASLGKIFLTENTPNSWGDNFPEFYRINIITSGATGVATYKFSVRKHLGFNGNTYTDLSVGVPYRNIDVAPAPNFHGWRNEDNDILRFSNTQVVQYDSTGVTLLNLMNGDYQTWDANTTPSLPLNTIRQVCTDGVKIWVSDRTVGLYEIDPSANTVTQRIGSPSYGVDVGNGKVWALVEGGLRNSDNWLSPVTFSFAGISDNNWNKVLFLKADPQHASNRLGLVMDAGSGNRRVVWWDAVSQSAIAGYQGADLRSYPANFDVSNTGGFWASLSRRHNYGSSTTNSLTGTPPGVLLTHSIYGNDSYYKIDFYKEFLIHSDRILNASNVLQNSYTGLPGSATCLHMDRGIVLLSDRMRQLFSDNVYCWEDYGWNGGAWELNNAGAKTTHPSNDTLINGLSIRFQDGATAPHFFATDFFTVAVCHGLLKDAATVFYHQSAWYTKPVFFDVPIPNGVTIDGSLVYTFPAASDPSFLFMETDSPKLYRLAIAGNPVATVYTNGTTNPAPGEVTINSAGFARFNAADVGKSFSGSYAWVAFS